jgi:hypothetical protein
MKAAANNGSENSKNQSDESSDNKVTEILDKVTQVYKLFSEGKNPMEVAIALALLMSQTSIYTIPMDNILSQLTDKHNNNSRHQKDDLQQQRGGSMCMISRLLNNFALSSCSTK